VDRFWLLTWTTYGTWLPGDARGFVSNVRDGDGPEVRHNRPGTAYDADAPGLVRSSRSTLKGPPVWLGQAHADRLVAQFRETAAFRGWALLAAAVMANHAHLVVGVPGDPDPEALLRDFKSYGSRALSAEHGRPASGTWWTEGGSRRKLPDGRAVAAAARYVGKQHNPLAVYIAATPASGGRQPPDAPERPDLANHQGADAPRSPGEHD
jgi:REP element-mobilizing transposase RayT